MKLRVVPRAPGETTLDPKVAETLRKGRPSRDVAAHQRFASVGRELGAQDRGVIRETVSVNVNPVTKYGRCVDFSCASPQARQDRR